MALSPATPFRTSRRRASRCAGWWGVWRCWWKTPRPRPTSTSSTAMRRTTEALRVMGSTRTAWRRAAARRARPSRATWTRVSTPASGTPVFCRSAGPSRRGAWPRCGRARPTAWGFRSRARCRAIPWRWTRGSRATAVWMTTGTRCGPRSRASTGTATAGPTTASFHLTTTWTMRLSFPISRGSTSPRNSRRTGRPAISWRKTTASTMTLSSMPVRATR